MSLRRDPRLSLRTLCVLSHEQCAVGDFATPLRPISQFFLPKGLLFVQNPLPVSLSTSIKPIFVDVARWNAITRYDLILLALDPAFCLQILFCDGIRREHSSGIFNGIFISFPSDEGPPYPTDAGLFDLCTSDDDYLGSSSFPGFPPY